MHHNNNEIFIDLDKTADILYVLRSGYDINNLINVDSDRVPGLIKRIDPITQECVGFMFNSFSVRFKNYVDCNEEHLKALMDMTLKLTNDRVFLSDIKAA